MTTKQVRELEKKIVGKPKAEVKRILCGKKIGQGCFRRTYEMRGFPEYVVKVARNFSGIVHNFQEWDNYGTYQFTPLGKWLCPVIKVTKCGEFLIMKKAEFPPSRKPYPKQIPDCLSDTKYKNYGFIDNQLVCVDYSCIFVRDFKLKNTRWMGTVK